MLKEQSEKSKYDKLVELFGDGEDGDLTTSGADPGREIRVAQREQEFLEKKAQEIAEQKVEALIKQGALSYPFWLALRDDVKLSEFEDPESKTVGCRIRIGDLLEQVASGKYVDVGGVEVHRIKIQKRGKSGWTTTDSRRIDGKVDRLIFSAN